MRAALRCRTDPEPFVLGELAIDYHRRWVTMASRPVELTATEYELLRVLSLNAGRVSTYDARCPVYIQTELRIGYRMPGAR